MSIFWCCFSTLLIFSTISERGLTLKPQLFIVSKNSDCFKKIDGFDYLKKKNEKYDLILFKQTIHFFSPSKLSALINIAKKRLEHEGKILVFSLKTSNNNKI